MTTLRSFSAGLAAALACGFGTVAVAGTYDSVYVFGDSLSDMGRVADLTGGIFPGPSTTPALNYAPGRFSNGPVAVEWMTQILTGSALTTARDYAYGGALTGVSPTTGFDSTSSALNGFGLQNQVAKFHADLGAGKADPNALYVVWAGANDFKDDSVLGNLDGQQWGRVIGNVATAIGNLAADGAQHFFVPNMPNLGLTPAAQAQGQAKAQLAAQATGLYNFFLSQSLTALDAGAPTIDIKQFDVYGLMNGVAAQVAANGSFGSITNMTVQCQTTPTCAGDSAAEAQAFFWDEQHPTAAVHQILGVAFAQAAAGPEPQTYALMLAGLGIVGWMARRRRA
ncbi:SGNH/GDSL hydrolase family protein [soil metagenome]